jgi:hypothetical protein
MNIHEQAVVVRRTVVQPTKKRRPVRRGGLTPDALLAKYGVAKLDDWTTDFGNTVVHSETAEV